MNSDRVKELGGYVKGLWSDSYRYFLKYHGRELTDKDWDDVVEDCGLLAEKYKSRHIARTMAVLVLGLIEEESR